MLAWQQHQMAVEQAAHAQAQAQGYGSPSMGGLMAPHPASAADWHAQAGGYGTVQDASQFAAQVGFAPPLPPMPPPHVRQLEHAHAALGTGRGVALHGGGEAGGSGAEGGGQAVSASALAMSMQQQQAEAQQAAAVQYAFSVEEAQSGRKDARATLMIRNIPNKYTQPMLLELLERDFAGTYDFFYLPMDVRNRCNLGYAFVNFVAAKHTVPFYRAFQGRTWLEFNSKKVCEVTFARVQGRKALLEHFRRPGHRAEQAGEVPQDQIDATEQQAAAEAPQAAPEATQTEASQHLPPGAGSPASRSAVVSNKRPWVSASFLGAVGLKAWPA